MFKSIACPEPAKGVVLSGKKLVVPNQAMSLEETLARFTRGEPLEVGQEVNYYDDADEDYSKLERLDLTERDEYLQKQRAIQNRFKKQEAAKLAASEQRLKDEALEKLKAELKEPEKA